MPIAAFFLNGCPVSRLIGGILIFAGFASEIALWNFWDVPLWTGVFVIFLAIQAGLAWQATWNDTEITIGPLMLSFLASIWIMAAYRIVPVDDIAKYNFGYDAPGHASGFVVKMQGVADSFSMALHIVITGVIELVASFGWQWFANKLGRRW